MREVYHHWTPRPSFIRGIFITLILSSLTFHILMIQLDNSKIETDIFRYIQREYHEKESLRSSLKQQQSKNNIQQQQSKSSSSSTSTSTSSLLSQRSLLSFQGNLATGSIASSNEQNGTDQITLQIDKKEINPIKKKLRTRENLGTLSSSSSSSSSSPIRSSTTSTVSSNEHDRHDRGPSSIQSTTRNNTGSVQQIRFSHYELGREVRNHDYNNIQMESNEEQDEEQDGHEVVLVQQGRRQHFEHETIDDDTNNITSSSRGSSRSSITNNNHDLKMYWNLSCPIELSMFSGVHMGGDYLTRAIQARKLVEDTLFDMTMTTSQQHDEQGQSSSSSSSSSSSPFLFSSSNKWKETFQNRRIVFVGDSLIRQIFISIACLSWDDVEEYAVPWFEQRGVRTRQPNTIGTGKHSKFEEGRVRIKGNIELIYHHGIGDVLELGPEYEKHDTNSWSQSCYRKQATIYATTLQYPKLKSQYDDTTDADSISSTASPSDTDANPSSYISTLTAKRESISLSSNDIILINASVHQSRSYNLRNIVDLIKCKERMNIPTTGVKAWPSMYYIATSPSHFPTETGAFEKELLERDDVYECKQNSTFYGYQEDEVTKLHNILPIYGRGRRRPTGTPTLSISNNNHYSYDLQSLQYHSGHLHVGGKDCLHWLQPGIPDLIAFDVLQSIINDEENGKIDNGGDGN